MGGFEKKLLPRCGGRLSIEEATCGMNAAVENARRLLDDAKLLLEAGRYPTAMSLSILAIEEAGKLSIIRSILVAPSEKALNEAWQDYRSHKSKNTAWILPDLVKRGARTLIGLREAVDKNAEHPVVLDILKQLGFYTDFVGNRNWTTPAGVIDESTARAIYSVAEILSKERIITEEEVSLWVEHLGPGSVHGLSQKGLAAYFTEGIERGIIKHDLDGAMKFLFGGASPISSTDD